jgi:hypothetical protein
MSDKHRETLVRLTKELIGKGLLIEAGFATLRARAIHPDALDDQVREMRMAFFAGAQHVFGSIMQVLDPDDGPTEADMRRMSAVHAELETFITEFTPMTDQQITAVRAYLRQWMDGAWTVLCSTRHHGAVASYVADPPHSNPWRSFLSSRARSRTKEGEVS